MEKDTKHAAMVVIAAAMVVVAVFVGISQASGVSPFQTVVESGSMQRGIGSQIGVIDTGDVVILKDKERVEIRTFVDGYKIGYEKFGNYGDVIIYSRDIGNPVIHRAILWLDYNGDGTWSAPSLEGYPAELWSCTGGDGYDRMWGTLYLKNMGYSGTVNANLDLDRLMRTSTTSGYLTMGDNNFGFDQPSGVSGVSGLISLDQINSVGWFEIPWIGSFKMILRGDVDTLDRLVPNTIPSLAAAFLLVIFLIVGVSFLFDHRFYRKCKRELYEEMYAPAPLFPVEHGKQ
ncbi:MAG: S26 family signal peptidase [Methanomassiliicoccaceae archaeon]|nr:S26 family signal peptidase [Methanomassiliicoccaceae archaeon]